MRGKEEQGRSRRKSWGEEDEDLDHKPEETEEGAFGGRKGALRESATER